MSARISELLTVIFTTSPSPSCPSTELLSSVLESFHTYCQDLLQCRVIVTFDTYDHITSFARLKRAQVTAQTAHDYDQYKQNVKNLILGQYATSDETHDLTNSTQYAEFGSPTSADNVVAISTSQTSDGKVTFLEPTRCLGFSLAVRSALRMCQTPYVWVHQHDWTFTTEIPLSSMLEVMQTYENNEEIPVKYICLPSVRMLSYAIQSDVGRFPQMRSLTTTLKRSFVPPSRPDECIPLTPVFFWYDKPHLASVQHYLTRVFPSRYATGRGDFIEDTIGRKARDQMKQGQWHKWACWLYYPDDGKRLCLRHLDGRRWRGVEGELKQKQMHMARMGPINPPEDKDRDSNVDSYCADHDANANDEDNSP